MKNILLLSLCMLLLLACKTTKKTKTTATDNYFEIQVEQDGKILPLVNNVIELKRKPFKFKLSMIKSRSIHYSTSWGTHFYNYPADENIFDCTDDFCFAPERAGAEDSFNTDRDIYLSASKDYQLLWFYEPEELDWYRMDKGAYEKNGVVYSEVTVENIFDLDKRDQEIVDHIFKVEQIAKQDIYVVCAAADKDEEDRVESQREKFILRFK